MKLLRLWKQYDSIKAAVMLFALAVFLIGYCIHAAADYAVILQTPSEYICAMPDKYETLLPRLPQTEGIRAYSPQKTAELAQNDRTLNITLLSAAYLYDSYGIETDAHVIFANDAAFAAICGDNTDQSVQYRGMLNGKPFAAEIIRTDTIPDGQPYAVTAAAAADLRDGYELRICLDGSDPALLEQLGLRIMNPEVQVAAEYEKKLVLLRIRFAALSAALSCIAAGAFLWIYRNTWDGIRPNPCNRR